MKLLFPKQKKITQVILLRFQRAEYSLDVKGTQQISLGMVTIRLPLVFMHLIH